MQVALQMTCMNASHVNSKYCESLWYVEMAQRSSLARSKGKTIYTDHRMCCPGVQPGRAERRVGDATHHRDFMHSEN